MRLEALTTPVMMRCWWCGVIAESHILYIHTYTYLTYSFHLFKNILQQIAASEHSFARLCLLYLDSCCMFMLIFRIIHVFYNNKRKEEQISNLLLIILLFYHLIQPRIIITLYTTVHIWMCICSKNRMSKKSYVIEN